MDNKAEGEVQEYDFIAIGDTVTDAFIKIDHASVIGGDDEKGSV